MRIKKFHKRTDRKLQFYTMDTVGFDKAKVDCFNCHKMGHFVRDCRAKKNQDSRRDGGYNGIKSRDNGRRPAYQDDSKALVTIDGEAIDWSGHGEEDTQNFAMMAYSFSNSGSDKETSADESDSKPVEHASSDSYSSVETTTSIPAPVDNAPKIVSKPKIALKDKGIFNSGCSRNMTRNKAHLADYQEFKGGSVAFGGRNGRITGKGKIKLAENQANKSAGPQEANNSTGTEANDDQDSSRTKIQKATDCKTSEKPVSQVEQIFQEELGKLKRQENKASDALIAVVAHLLGSLFFAAVMFFYSSFGGSVLLFHKGQMAVSTPVSTVGPSKALNDDELSYPDDPSMPHIEDIYASPSAGIFSNSSYDDEGVVTDFNNSETTVNTRSKVHKNSEAHTLVSYIQKQQRNNHKDFQHCLFACFLSQVEPKKISQALEDESWVDAMQEELLQFQIQKVWILLDLPFGKKAIETKWVKQMEDCIFISQDKYVAEILKKFDFLCVKTASTPIETQKPLVKDEEAAHVDIHLYRGGYLKLLLPSKELASPKQTTLGKDESNSLIVDSLLKTIRSSMHHVIAMKHWLFQSKRLMLEDMSHHQGLYDNPSLTKKVFANMKRVDIGFSGVITPLFEDMLVPAAEEVGQAQDDVSIPTEPSTSKPYKKQKSKKQQPIAPKVPSPEPSPEHQLPSPSNDPIPDADKDSLKLQELVDLCIILSNKVLDLESEVIDIKSSFTAKIDQIEDKEEHAEVEEVLKVVKAAKLMTEVVTTAQPTTIATQVPKASALRRRRGVVTQDHEETARSVIVHTEVQPNDKGKGILIEEPKPMKRQAQIKQDEAFTRHEIRPLFKKHNNSIQAFLEKKEEEITVQEKAIEEEGKKRQDESLEHEIAKKQKMDKEAEELKRHMHIMANDDDDVFKKLLL
nr:putative ribonuclease H-like domain-containing protein [Tanacetum cinerariifolium]